MFKVQNFISIDIRIHLNTGEIPETITTMKRVNIHHSKKYTWPLYSFSLPPSSVFPLSRQPLICFMSL